MKLDTTLEARLRAAAARQAQRQRRHPSSAGGLPRRRRACKAPSAYELGCEFFGRHEGPADLAEQRRSAVADVWAEKRDGRRGAA
ncbi:MAG: hypothetical protein MZW92_19135 [Comamonadaceae bacterium]|nr:hypothetical protein [Comamonadaceae bacterium]